MVIKKYNLIPFFVIFTLYTVSSGMVHPVTPAFIEAIGAPNSTFGVAFTGMALGQFVFSPLWGKLGDRLGYTKLISIGLILYGTSAFIFNLARTWQVIVFARFLGGVGISAVVVSCMAYIISIDAPTEDKNQLLVLYAALQSIGSSFGYLLGGLAGDINLNYAFYLQAITLIIYGVLFFIFVKNPNTFVRNTNKLTAREVNPLASIIDSSKLINPTVGIFLFSVFLTMIASSGFDQNFNYFLRITFDFSPSSSGMLKAVIAIVSLVANLTINIWIVKNKNIATAMCFMISLASIGIVATMISSSLALTLFSSLIYYTSFAIYSPLQQTVMSKNSTDDSSKGAISGLFNASKSFGMIVGPLFAGMVFDINPNIAFSAFAICFIFAVILSYINYKKLVKQGVEFKAKDTQKV